MVNLLFLVSNFNIVFHMMHFFHYIVETAQRWSDPLFENLYRPTCKNYWLCDIGLGSMTQTTTSCVSVRSPATWGRHWRELSTRHTRWGRHGGKTTLYWSHHLLLGWIEGPIASTTSSDAIAHVKQKVRSWTDGKFAGQHKHHHQLQLASSPTKWPSELEFKNQQQTR